MLSFFSTFILIICFQLSLLLIFSPGSVLGGSSKKNVQCETIGACLLCGSQEYDANYCRDTGRRVKIHCKTDDTEYDEYKSCISTAEDDQVKVIVFQVLMAILGGLAYWGVQSRKKFNMTLFDHRKLR